MKNRIHVEGDAYEVFKQIIDRNENKEASTKKPVLIILGGVLRGVYGGGGVEALGDAGLYDGFEAVVGVSTGAPTGAYFLAQQPALGTSIYYEECLSSHFMSFWHILFFKPFINMRYLDKIWRGEIGNKKMDLEKIKSSSSKLIIAVTKYLDGTGILTEVNKNNDLISPIVASCTIPYLSEGKVMWESKYYIDGAMSLSFPVQEIFEKIHPTSVLVFPNRDINYKDGILVKIWEWIVFQASPSNMRKELDYKNNRYEKELKFLRESKIPYTIVWCDKEVSAFTTDKNKLKKASERYRAFVQNLIQKRGPKIAHF